MKNYKLGEIAVFLQAELRGDPNLIISGIAPLIKANSAQISFLENAKYRKYLVSAKAGAVILNQKNLGDYAGNVLLVKSPYVSYAKLSKYYYQPPPRKVHINVGALIGQNCIIDPSVSIANSTIGENVKIGSNTVVESGVIIGDDVEIGTDCYIYANVSIYRGVKIGNNAIIHSGAVIGADGFGMANDNGKWCKIYQLGGVLIGSDVEIGANTCIDRGALEDTIVEDGVKLDNLIQVGHNVKIGAHTVIAGCTAIAGSAVIGKHCMIGGACAINGHISIADNVIITGGSTVGLTVEKAGIYSSGVTVQPHLTWMKIFSRIIQLDNFAAKIRKLGVKMYESDEH